MMATCECGCGRTTTGRFVLGHNARKTADDYRVEDRGYDTDCWIWQRRITEGGYGRIQRNGRKYQAHRWFYEQAHGPIPAGLHIDHLCNVRSCVNPDHLEAVTPFENGQRSHPRALTPEQAAEVKAATGTCSEVAKRFGVSKSVIHRARHGRYDR